MRFFRFTKKTGTNRKSIHAQKALGPNIATFLIVSIILMARGWGAQSRVDWEETFGIGLTLTKNTAAIWEPNNYGVLTARLLHLIVVQLPLIHLPAYIFVIATLFWMVCLITIFDSVLFVTKNRLFASMVVIGLALLPTPVIGGQGVIQGSWWLQTFTLMVVLAAFPVLDPLGKRGISVLIFTAVTVASFPVAMCLAVPSIFALTFRSRPFKKWDATLVGAIVVGSVYQVAVFSRRESVMSYLGEWAPNQKNEINANYIWSEMSAMDRRALPRMSLGELPRSLYISVNSTYSELMPEPLRSLIRVDKSWVFILFVMTSLAVLVLSVTMAYLRMENKRINNFVIRLTIFLVPIFIFQFMTVGTIQNFQYANLFDMAYVVIVCGLIISCINQRKYLNTALTAGLTLIFVVSASQHFRDSDRYGSGWANGYKLAKSQCQWEDPNEVVVISQGREITSESFSPIGIRCRYLR